MLEAGLSAANGSLQTPERGLHEVLGMLPIHRGRNSYLTCSQHVCMSWVQAGRRAQLKMANNIFERCMGNHHDPSCNMTGCTSGMHRKHSEIQF